MEGENLALGAFVYLYTLVSNAKVVHFFVDDWGTGHFLPGQSGLL